MPFTTFIFLVVEKHDAALIPNPASLTELPELKGYLNKYTNMLEGYNMRWFVLEGGMLSCASKAT